MKGNHVTVGLFFIAVCLGIGLLMAVAQRSHAPSANEATANAAAPAGIDEANLVAANREPEMDAAPAISGGEPNNVVAASATDPGIASGDRSCVADILEDSPAIGGADAVLRRGETWTDVTQYWRNERTGETWYCAHGDYCYPNFVTRGDRRIESIRLRNCQVGQPVSRDGEEVLYDVQ